MGFFRLDRRGPVAVATLDKPPANTLDYALYDELALLLAELENDDKTRAVVFASANPKVFISGADLKDMRSYDRRRGAVARKVDTVHGAFLRLQRLAKPTIGAITGHALGGGCEFALCLDFRIMSDGAACIGLPEVTLGMVPGGGGTQRLARLVGRARATELLMLGTRLHAREAHRIGLVHEACAGDDATMERAVGLGEELADRGPVAIRLIKRALNDGVDVPLAAGLAVEREGVVEAMDTEDAREGVAAFLERRRPRFLGR